MTIEESLVAYLSTKLPVHVSGDVPSPRPSRFVTVEQTGSSTANHVYSPTVAVQSWAGSRTEASELNELVKKVMAEAVYAPEISRCKLDTDYNFPDLETLHPRYQAIFEITFLG